MNSWHSLVASKMLVAALCTTIAPPIGRDDICFRYSSLAPIKSFTIQLEKDRTPVTGHESI